MDSTKGTVHTLAAGTTLLGTNPHKVDVTVDGDGILPVHCELNVVDANRVVLLPAESAVVAVNDTPVVRPVLLPCAATVTLGTNPAHKFQFK